MSQQTKITIQAAKGWKTWGRYAAEKFAKIVGDVPRPERKKGHAEKIYQIVGKSGLKVEYNLMTATNQSECIA